MASVRVEESFAKSAGTLAEIKIIIAGPSRFQNELIGYYLSEKGGAQCDSLVCKDARTVDEKPLNGNCNLVMWDWQTPGLQEVVEARLRADKPALEQPYWVLYNGKRDTELFKAVWLGVRGVFHEEEPIGNIIQGLKAICNGELWFSRKTINNWLVSIPKDLSGPPRDPASSLSRREKEVLRMLSKGFTNDQIADKLFVSTHTIRTHVYNIFKKIGVMNRVQATLWTQRHLNLSGHLNLDQLAVPPQAQRDKTADL